MSADGRLGCAFCGEALGVDELNICHACQLDMENGNLSLPVLDLDEFDRERP